MEPIVLSRSPSAEPQPGLAGVPSSASKDNEEIEVDSLADRPTPAAAVEDEDERASKGKENIEEDPLADRPTPAAEVEGEDEMETCGICLAEGGRIRGHIDSCDHYFCFICILEWAKIESLCPLCRQRFRSIHRPTVEGLFCDERDVHVPVRDQVYHPLGIESTRISEPYCEVNCTICHGSTNEELLLLCELCDSGAHTYCVGLGATIPEGDWYCPDCTISMDEHSKLLDSDNSHQASGEISRTAPITEQPVSIFNIVSEETDSELSFRTRTGTQDSTLLTELVLPLPPISRSASSNLVTERGARTLRNRRDVHDRVRVLRENWSALRAGSITFSSLLQGSKLKEANSMSSSIQASHDIRKAWKMMEKAIKLQKYPSIKEINDSLNPCGQMNSFRRCEGNDAVFSSAYRTCLSNVTFSSAFEGKKHLPTPRVPHNSNLQRKYEQMTNTVKGGNIETSHQSPESGYIKLPSSGGDRYFLQQTASSGESKEASEGAFCQTPLLSGVQVARINPGSIDNHASSFSAQPATKEVKNFNASKRTISRNTEEISQLKKNKVGNNSSDMIESSGIIEMNLPSNERLCLTSSHCSSMYRSDSLAGNTWTAEDGLKSEIQLLVKNNLSLLDRDRRLGAEGYKQVARIATHTILAACGLEHSRSIARPFSSQICNHSEQLKQLGRSSLMHKSCKECFYTFVHDIVGSVMSEEKFHSKP